MTIAAYRVAFYIPKTLSTYGEFYFSNRESANAKKEELQKTLTKDYVVEIQTIER